jgi:hypothetical protein
MHPEFLNVLTSEKRGYRSTGFTTLFKKMFELGRPLSIVETGTTRGLGNQANDMFDFDTDGSATLLFDKFCELTGSTCISVDIDEQACSYARELVKNVQVICGDSVEVISSSDFPIGIDVLYLDSMDLTDPQNWYQKNYRHPTVVDYHNRSAVHHLMEVAAFMEHRNDQCIIACDDCVLGSPEWRKIFNLGDDFVGKDTFVTKFLSKADFQMLEDSYQKVWFHER